MLAEIEVGESMRDVAWRTGCTFAILLLLALLGSGTLIEAPNPAAAPLPTGEGAWGAAYAAGLPTPEAGGNLSTEHEGALPPGPTADERQPVARIRRLAR
jgi:hypothetical protein